MNDPSSTVLIFPASYYQLDLFRAAQDLNYRIATFDYAADNPGHQIADISQIIDVRDLDAALEFARAQNISAVCSVCSDVSLAALAHISEGLGFAGPSPVMINALTSKINFRRWQEQFSRAPIAFTALDTPHLSATARAALPARVVIKPDIASGSKGIYICEADDVSDALLKASARESLNGRVVIEQCVTGEHFTFEGFLQEGAFVFQMCTARLRNPKDQIGTVGHIFPSGLSAAVQDQLMQDLSGIFTHFDYHNGPVDCDFVVSGDQISILEVTPRLGGNAISKLASASFGISLPQYYLRSQLGLPLVWPDIGSGKAAAVCLITSDVDGCLSYSTEALEPDALPAWVSQAEVDYPSGTLVRCFKDGRDRLGEVTVFAETTAEVHARFADVLRHLDLSVAPS